MPNLSLQDAFTHAEVLFGKAVQVRQTIVRDHGTLTVECEIGFQRQPEGTHFWKGRTFEEAIRSARGMPHQTL